MKAVAFFDFDETLFRYKSMFHFLEYYAQQRFPETALEQLAFIHSVLRSFVHREDANRYYYSLFAGTSEKEMQRLARGWYEHLMAHDEHCLITSTVAELRHLQRMDYETVLVSGSFDLLLAPFAEQLGIHYILCAQPQVTNGVLTGALAGEPVIGKGKVEAIRGFLREAGVPAGSCVGYGDHHSDIPMLECLGSAAVVNPSPELKRHARRRGWRLVSG